MTAVEKILLDGLQKDPGDWSVRLELAGKMAERGAKDEAAKVLSDAPEPAPTEEILRKAASLAGDENPAARGLFEAFVLENPSSAFAHLSLARIQSAKGNIGRARKHYETAIALDAGLKDSSLEAKWNPASGAAGPVQAPPEPFDAPSEPEPMAVPAPRPLAPPPGFEAESEETADAEEAEPIAVAAIFADDDDDGEPVAAATLATDEDADGADSFGRAETLEDGERVFIVSEGELIHAHEKESDIKAKISALTVALLVHVGVLALLGFVVISMPRPSPPQLVASAIESTENNDIEEKVVERIQRNAQTATAQMNVVSTVAASPVTVPQFDTNSTTFEALGNTTDFGMSMAFDMSEDGAMVSFFGSKSISKKVIFVVDYSASMTGPKDKLMRKELTKSLEALPNGVRYALIMFSGPAWFAGQEAGKAEKIGQWIGNEVRDGGKKWIWYQGWDEKQRVTPGGDRKSALEHFSEGFDKLPRGEYILASRTTIRKTVKQVEDTPLLYGTDWRSPLMMAMDMEPDTIYFMTDGSLPSPPKGVQKSEVMKELLAYNRKKSRAKINTICMMVLQAREELEMLADGSRGEFTLVLEDGTAVRGKDLEKVPVGKGKGKGKGKK